MYDFRKTELETLAFWRDHKIFEKSLAQRKEAKRWVFFEGPPTANGRPGIHHFLGRSFKDLFCRYKTMRGFFVLRKAGWDTHGLPVELEVEKQLGFKSKKDIETYGIAQFNAKARESVWKYKSEWEEMTRRMGFWLDMSDPYVTYETPYIESIWHILKKASDAGLLVKAHKVVPFCTRCGTPLSSHEVAQGYRQVTDTSVYLKFQLKAGQSVAGHPLLPFTHVLAWTTTPWTLPGNVALAVGPDIEYAVVHRGGEAFIVASSLVQKILGEDVVIDRTVKGSDLVGLAYEPLFDIPELRSETSHKVYPAGFVSTTDGTGIVHTAVMYGEDDYVLGTELGLPKFHTVTEEGKFTHVSSELDDRFVKSPETEKIILDHLVAGGRLFKSEPHEHDYPFCWRCDSPLLYYAKSSWFIKMSSLRDQMIKANSTINWVPAHIKDGRFGQWLRELKDWAISRERYWGTPLPVWQCVKCEYTRTVGSVAELVRFGQARRNIYFLLRHGLSTRNEDTQVIINSDLAQDHYPLTEEGRQAAQKVAQELEVDDGVDIIISSPFKRTRETAEVVGKQLHVEVEIDDRLREFHHAAGWDGKLHRDCPAVNRRYTFDEGYEDSETYNQLRRRVADFMADMESRHKGKRVLIVSHGNPLEVINFMAEGLNEKEITARQKVGSAWYPQPAELCRIEWPTYPRNELGETDLHRPFIDDVTFKCPKCRAAMKRVPDLIDVWFDSGAMPFAQWHYPFEGKAEFKDQYPADFIVEGIDQTRGWFYTLLAIATFLDKKPPFRNVMSLSHVLDEKGKKMSKSKGNIVLPNDVIEKVGSDAARWFFYTVNDPADTKLFAMRDVELRLKGILFTLENCLRFYDLYRSGAPEAPPVAKAHLLDQWILSRFHGLVQEATTAMDTYDSLTAARAIEAFVMEDLSNWWLRRSRKRSEALPLLKTLMIDISKLIGPFMPFVADHLYRSLAGEKESVHLADWPKFQRRLINPKLESEMEECRTVVTEGLALRKAKTLKVRQPLASVTIKRAKKFKPDIELLIRDELNVKKIVYVKDGDQAVFLDEVLNEALRAEGYAREVIRQIQDMRKEAGYRVDELVMGYWQSDDAELASAIDQWSETISRETMLKNFERGQAEGGEIEKEFEVAPQKKILLRIKR